MRTGRIESSAEALRASRPGRLLIALALAALAAAAGAQVFHDDFARPSGAALEWLLAEGQGRWETAPDGKRILSVTGNGEDMAYWARRLPDLRPGKTYAIRFRARALPGSSPWTIIAGLDACNRDFPTNTQWTEYSFIFTTPSDVSRTFLRLGHWHLQGTVQFADVELLPVEALHRKEQGLTLGEGEQTYDGFYTFSSTFSGLGSNSSRCLHSHTAPFNTNRWVFSQRLSVTYRHDVGSLRQTSGHVRVTIGYYTGGSLLISASRDGKQWVEAGRVSGSGLHNVTLPPSLFPAEQVLVRLEGASDDLPAGNSAPGALQVEAYSYGATLEKAAPTVVGHTLYAQVVRGEPKLALRVEDPGGLGYAGAGVLAVSLQPARDLAGSYAVRLQVMDAQGKPAESFGATVDASAGRRAEAFIPFRIRRTGDLQCILEASRIASGRETLIFQSRIAFHLSPYLDADYGYPLSPVPDGDLWWCESTYKVHPDRLPPPQTFGATAADLRATRGQGAIVLKAARREREHAQLVFRPAEDPGPVQVTLTALIAPGGRVIPRRALEIREVAYVRVTHPTDRTGLIGDWPDPLPPLHGAWHPRKDRNNVLWLTVTVPANAQAGTYQGLLTLQTKKWKREIVVRLQVWDFALPERTALRSGFGVSPWAITRYHNLTRPEDIQKVWDLYMEAFRTRRLNPYNPMALAPYSISVEGMTWSGGRRDTSVAASGTASLRIEDSSTSRSVSAVCARPIPIDPGVRYVLSWKCRTEKPDQPYLVTVSHLNAGGIWMPGRNNDIERVGSGEWQEEMVDITDRIPEDARFVQVTLRPTVWTEAGENTGVAWFDDVQLVAVTEDGPKPLLEDGGFEKEPELRLKLDFTEFDKAARRYLDGMGFNAFTIHIEGLPGGRYPNFYEGSFQGYAPDTPEYDILMRQYGKLLEDHLAANGWLDKAYVYWYDEPEEYDYPIVQEGARRLKKYFPRLKRMMTEQFEEPLYGFVDLWCPGTPMYDEVKARARQALGEEVWWYVCTGPKEPYCTLFIDKPAIELRMWLWQTWQRSIQGILIWETCWWTSPYRFRGDTVQNPWEDPMAYVADQPGVWGNGDGRFFYPPNRDPNGDRTTPYVTGPVISIRWEMLAEGVEDWEYFRTLERALKAAEARGRRDEAVVRARRLLKVPPTITSDLTHFTTDPRLIYRHREAIARTIEDLASPRPPTRTRR